MTDILIAWGERDDQLEQEAPTWADIRAKIAELDGTDRTLVTIYRGDSHLAVGGSAASGLVVYCTHDNEVFWQLLAENDLDTPVDVVAGGQVGTYPLRNIVGLNDALIAAKEFSEHGRITPVLRWES